MSTFARQQAKTIVMIHNGRFLPDIRVEQEYQVLRQAGYRVIVVAGLRGAERSGYEIVRIQPNALLSGAFNRTLVYNPLAEQAIARELAGIGVTNVDVVHVHDLYWSFLGQQLRRRYGSKLIIDLHENYPEFVRDMANERKLLASDQVQPSGKRAQLKASWQAVRGKATRLFEPSVERLKRYEDRVLSRCDGFITVVPEALERFRGKPYYARGTVVSNTKDAAEWPECPLPEARDRLVTTYMGTVQDLRGLDTVIAAMRHLDQSKHEFVIVGVVPGSQMKKRLEDVARENGVSNVRLVDWLADESAANEYVRRSDICVVPHRDTGLTQSTVPHKLFMYMATGRPVLVSDVAPLKRIVDSTRCGLTFKAGDPSDCALALERLRDRRLREECARNGRKAAEGEYDWSNDAARLRELYERVCRAAYR